MSIDRVLEVIDRDNYLCLFTVVIICTAKTDILMLLKYRCRTMLFKKSIIFALISSFAFTPIATAIEDGKTTETKKDNNSLKNKCNLNNIQSNKANKYSRDRVVKSPYSNQIAKLETSPKQLVDEVWQIVYEQYVDPDFNQVDWLALRNKHLQKSYQDYSQAYADIKQMLNLLEDPYTRFLNPEEYGQLTGVKKSSNPQNRLKTTKLAQHTANIPTVSSEIKDLGDRTVSYIRLTKFDNTAASKIKQAIEDAESQQASGYILDLRSNSGGLLLSAIDVARMFLNRGTIVNILARSEAENQRYDASNKALTNKPLTVLIDGQSASGTEILASALKENNRATLVGEKTYGQGSIQSVRSLSNGSGLAVTVARFLTANCNRIEGEGIKPEIVVKPTSLELSKLTNNSSLLGTSEDPAYNKALEALRSQF